MRLYLSLMVSLSLCIALLGCGGGGGSNSPVVIPDDPNPPGVNQGPTITSISPTSPVSIGSSQQRTITVAATDPDGDPLTYSWQVEGGGTIRPSDQGHTAVFTAPGTSTPMSCEVTVSVADNHSHMTSAIIIFDVNGETSENNDPPVINDITADPSSVALGQTSRITVAADDPDGDTLSLVWFCDAGAIETQNGVAAVWRAPNKAGTYGITVSVSDGINPAVLGQVKVTVGQGGGSPITNGLTATYIKNSGKTAHPNLSDGTVVLTRIDPSVNFDWDRRSPLPQLVTNPATGDANDFGVRWTGHVLCSAPGSYTFKVRYDDGARVWITNDKNQRMLLIDSWSGGPMTRQASIPLEGSKWYPITVEFFEDEANAYIQLLWTPPGGSEQVVPTNLLRAD